MQQSKSLSTSLASSSVSWVLANDIAGLKEVLQGFVGLSDLERTYILSLRGEVLSSTRSGEARVETEAQRELLTSYGCPKFQGYLFGQPVPANIFKQSLLTKQAKNPSAQTPWTM